MQDNDEIEFVRKSFNWQSVSDEDSAFYMRIHGEGQYRFYGANMGVLVFRGRMQSDDRELHKRAKVWSKKILNEFESVAPN